MNYSLILLLRFLWERNMKVCIFQFFHVFLRSLNSGSVHTYPYIFENGKFILRFSIPHSVNGVFGHQKRRFWPKMVP